MTEAAAHHKQMEDLMAAKVFWQLVKDRELQSVKDSADGIDDTAGQKPSEGSGRKGGHQWFKYKHAGPAHADVDDGADPVRAVDNKYLKSDADKSGCPHENQKRDAAASRESQQAYRRVGAGDQNEDHRVIDTAKQQVHLRGDIQRVIETAGTIKKNHAPDENRHGKYGNTAVTPGRLENQREGADNSASHGDKMCDGTSGVF